jgi:hypothetical protein
MANGHGGWRPGAGRKRKPTSPALARQVAYARELRAIAAALRRQADEVDRMATSIGRDVAAAQTAHAEMVHAHQTLGNSGASDRTSLAVDGRSCSVPPAPDSPCDHGGHPSLTQRNS